MAILNLKYTPELTKEKLKDVLADHFEKEGYEVGYSRLIGADIYVKKNGWVGVAIKLKQKNNSTSLRINGYAPSTAVRLLMYGLITFLILWPKWKRLTKDVMDFVITKF